MWEGGCGGLKVITGKVPEVLEHLGLFMYINCLQTNCWTDVDNLVASNISAY
jgi:hypothetical protein